MTTTIELNKSDIVKIIAKNYGVAPAKVTLEVVPVSVGYGTGEHTEHRISATVTR